jgi:esterase/lipase
VNETIIEYSKRLIEKYGIGKEEEFGILGVSFGGLVATEISKLTKPKFTILISSVETRTELSGIIKLAGKSRLIELIPEKLLNPPKAIAHFIVQQLKICEIMAQLFFWRARQKT